MGDGEPARQLRRAARSSTMTTRRRRRSSTTRRVLLAQARRSQDVPSRSSPAVGRLQRNGLSGRRRGEGKPGRRAARSTSTAKPGTGTLDFDSLVDLTDRVWRRATAALAWTARRMVSTGCLRTGCTARARPSGRRSARTTRSITWTGSASTRSRTTGRKHVLTPELREQIEPERSRRDLHGLARARQLRRRRTAVGLPVQAGVPQRRGYNVTPYLPLMTWDRPGTTPTARRCSTTPSPTRRTRGAAEDPQRHQPDLLRAVRAERAQADAAVAAQPEHDAARGAVIRHGL